MNDFGFVLGLRQIRDCLAQKTKCGSNLRRLHIDLPKDMILKAIYELTGFDLGTGFVVVPDLAGTGCHTCFGSQKTPRSFCHSGDGVEDVDNCLQRVRDSRLVIRDWLCRGATKRGDKRDWPVRRCQFRDSKLTIPLQLADILIGAIAYQLNGHDKAKGANPAKVELARHVMRRAGIADITKGTARVAKFSVWPRRLRRVVPSL